MLRLFDMGLSEVNWSESFYLVTLVFILYSILLLSFHF